MKLKTNHWLKSGPSRQFDWSAVDQDIYDGSKNEIGYGSTELEAIADLLRLKLLIKLDENILNGDGG